MHSRFIFSLLIVGIVLSYISESVALPNPAALYCLDTGGTSISRTRSDGSLVGECMLSNGIICEEWAYYRGECSGGGNT